MDIMATVKLFSSCYIEHEHVNHIMDDLDSLRARRHLSKDQQCILITGEAGSGKSALIDHYKSKALASQLNCRQIPILLTRISAKRDLDSTLVQMLHDLELFGAGRYKSRRGFVRNLEKDLVEALKRTKVELIIINEFQEILEYKSKQERQAIGNSLKYISEEAQVPIAFVGMPWAEAICEDPQWESRLIRRRKLTHFHYIDKDKRKYYLRYIKGLANRLPLEFPPDFASPDLSARLFAASNGENRLLKELLIEALIFALNQKSNTISITHLVSAYSKLFPEQPNLFEIPIEELTFKEVESASRINSDMQTVDQLTIGPKYTKPMALNDILSLK